MKTIGFIGGGNMAQALIEGVLNARLVESANVWVSDVRPERLTELKARYGVSTTSDNKEVVQRAGTIILSIKPQMMDNVLNDIACSAEPDKLFISIAAGITTDRIRRQIGNVQIIRVMPNTPALVGAGASGIFAASASKSAADAAVEIFASVGKAVIVDREDLIDSVTALSGSGPAYFFLLMEEMIRAGVELGLDEKTAAELTIQTAKGAALLAQSAQASGEAPAQLRRKVTSPGGTTEAAIKTFISRGFSAIIMDALTAARNRGRELSAG